ncbi:hypothetical protein [Streptomyces sp. SolWspMP-sol7th]|uniref:hypothetical protein n=1 Tax=Streptomyces sp. SolWspMP-sol7th TaxID=1839776 RepID=UPI0020C77181|nr:hypothetical protein [Streptomyces sp. SolWspMP-sol7th]
MIALLVGWLFWSLLYNGYLWGNWWQAPLTVLIKTTPLESQSTGAAYVSWAYIFLVAALVTVMVARLGRWPELWRRYSPWSRTRRETTSAASPPPAPTPHGRPRAMARAAGGR